MRKSIELKVEMWGNSLAVRLPPAIARSAKLSAGQSAAITCREGVISIVPVGACEVTLSERLAAYDPERHGGEAMAARARGEEVS